MSLLVSDFGADLCVLHEEDVGQSGSLQKRHNLGELFGRRDAPVQMLFTAPWPPSNNNQEADDFNNRQADQLVVPDPGCSGAAWWVASCGLSDGADSGMSGGAVPVSVSQPAANTAAIRIKKELARWRIRPSWFLGLGICTNANWALNDVSAAYRSVAPWYVSQLTKLVEQPEIRRVSAVTLRGGKPRAKHGTVYTFPFLARVLRAKASFRECLFGGASNLN